MDSFIKELLDDHRKYLISTSNLIANSISDMNWARVKRNMSRLIKYSVNPASLVSSIISPCGFVPATFPINFGSRLQLPVQYIIVPIEEHSTVAEFIRLNPSTWTTITKGSMQDVGHRIMLPAADSSEILGLICLESPALKERFKQESELSWKTSVELLRINNFNNVYYGDIDEQE